MSAITYTMFVGNGDGTDKIVARGVTLPRALVLALEHGGRGKATIVHSDIGPFRYFAIGRRPADGGHFECATYTVVQRSDSPGLDADHAMEVFEQVLLQHPYEFWNGRVVTDEDFACRHPMRKADVTETTRLTTFLPGFGGFHGTQWENLFPFSRRMCADRFAREEGAAGLDAADFERILRETSDASRFFASLAARFCQRYDAETSAWLGFELGLTFSELDIPTVHGGTTDVILAMMPVNGARRLLARSAEEGHRRLLASIRDRFAACEGVVPYPEEAVAQWLAEPIERWGRTELCDLLAGFVDPEIDERLYADMTAGSDLRMSFEDAVDWTRFADLLAVRRRAPSTPVAAGTATSSPT